MKHQITVTEISPAESTVSSPSEKQSVVFTQTIDNLDLARFVRELNRPQRPR